MPSHIHLPVHLEIVVRSAIVYLAMLAGLRLAGKRHTGQLSPHDFVLILLVSNAVQNAMVGEDSTVHGGLIAAATLIVLNTLLSRFVLQHERVSRFLTGEPTLLVHNGRIVEEHLKQEGIRRDELEAQITRGVLRVGDKVPSIRQQSRAMDVSINTILQAYTLLEGRGTIESRPQSGFYVAAPRLMVSVRFHASRVAWRGQAVTSPVIAVASSNRPTKPTMMWPISPDRIERCSSYNAGTTCSRSNRTAPHWRCPR